MLTRLITIDGDEVLLVKGPASIRVKSGRIICLGADIGSDERILVRKNKVIPFETLSEKADFVITLGEDGDFQATRGRFGVKIWRDFGERILSDLGLGCRRVVIVGETDSGKSTMSAYIINKALSKGLKVGIIDGDVGQADITPPGCIGAAVVRSRVFDLRDLRAEFYGFIGMTSPHHAGEAIISEMVRAQDYLEDKNIDLTVVNTDGYIRDGGFFHKIDLLKRLQPDLTVCITGIQDEEGMLQRLKDALALNMVAVEKPDRISKNPSERGERRLSQYRRFLKDSRIVNVSLHNLKIRFLGALYDTATHLPYEDSRILMCGRNKSGGSFKIVYGQEASITSNLYEGGVEFTHPSLKGMFIGLYDKDSLVGFGHILKATPDLSLRISATTSTFDTISLSVIRLSYQLTEEYITPIFTYTSK